MCNSLLNESILPCLKYRGRISARNASVSRTWNCVPSSVNRHIWLFPSAIASRIKRCNFCGKASCLYFLRFLGPSDTEPEALISGGGPAACAMATPPPSADPTEPPIIGDANTGICCCCGGSICCCGGSICCGSGIAFPCSSILINNAGGTGSWRGGVCDCCDWLS